jgi:hypothetical protein
MDSSARFLSWIVSDEPINQVEGNEVKEAIAPITVSVLPSSPIPKLPESRSASDAALILNRSSLDSINYYLL